MGVGASFGSRSGSKADVSNDVKVKEEKLSAKEAEAADGSLIVSTPQEYMKCFLSPRLHTDASVLVKGLAGRVCRGACPEHFEMLLGRSSDTRRLVQFSGPDALEQFMRKSAMQILLQVGYGPLYIYDKVKSGWTFCLVVYNCDAAWRLTWDGLQDALTSEYPDVLPVFVAHKKELQETSFSLLEEAYMKEGWSALTGSRKEGDTIKHVDLEQLLTLHQKGEAKAHHVRAWLYEQVNIRENFRGDGFSWLANGTRGTELWISSNMRMSDVIQSGGVLCPIGSPTILEITRYICDALASEHRRREAEKSPSSAQVVPQPSMPAKQLEPLRLSPAEYVSWLQERKQVPETHQLVGLCGRICRGRQPKDFCGLAELDGSRRVVFMMGSEGLAGILKETSVLAILLRLGYDVLFLYREMMRGTTFELVVMMEGPSAVRATWDLLPSVLDAAFDREVVQAVQVALPTLKRLSFAELQAEYINPRTGEVMSMRDARDSVPSATSGEDSPSDEDPSPWRMTARRLAQRARAGSCRAADVRAFLYHEIGLNNLFAGDGFTRTQDGAVGLEEFLAANVERQKLLGEWAACSLGAPTLDECMQEVCRAYLNLIGDN